MFYKQKFFKNKKSQANYEESIKADSTYLCRDLYNELFIAK